MAGFLSNVGNVLRGVVSQAEIREVERADSVQETAKSVRETRRLSPTLGQIGDDGGGGGTGRGPTGGGSTGGGVTGGGGTVVPPLSPTFVLLVKLNFALIICLLAAAIGLAVWGDPAKPAIGTAFSTMITLVTGSIGTFVGLIGGKAV